MTSDRYSEGLLQPVDPPDLLGSFYAPLQTFLKNAPKLPAPYRRAFRQPAARASASEQNQRSPYSGDILVGL